MQCKRTSSFMAESNSRRNESHGSDMLLGGSIGKVFPLHIREEIPMCRRGGTMLSQPCSLNLGHRVVTKCIFTCQTRTLQGFEPRLKLFRSRSVVVDIRYFAGQSYSKSQPILPVTEFGIADQPIPVHVYVS